MNINKHGNLVIRFPFPAVAQLAARLLWEQKVERAGLSSRTNLNCCKKLQSHMWRPEASAKLEHRKIWMIEKVKWTVASQDTVTARYVHEKRVHRGRQLVDGGVNVRFRSLMFNGSRRNPCWQQFKRAVSSVG